MSRFARAGVVLFLLVSLAAPASWASDWPHWRGPSQNGVSDAKGLVSSWTPDGENMLWKADFIGRSTPIVMNGRVFVMGRGGEGATRAELVAAFDAQTGEKLWERVVPLYLTTVPYNRAGWASLGADRETGYLYAQGVAGPFVCYDQDGNVVWQRMLHETDGRYSGYGGRTHTPVVDEDRVIVSVINGSWGKLGAPRHRYYAFDKRTGDVLWISTPGGNVYDRNTTSNGVIGVIDGRRLYISGNADGHIYALAARTGEKVWGFELSKRGINSSPVLAGNLVIVGHSEENIDEATLGRTIALDATSGLEVWRREIKMGFPSAAVAGERVYVMDNSANLYALKAEDGSTIWEYDTGTVGKQAPVLADGKLYVTETNGNFHIIDPTGDEPKGLDHDELQVPDGRYAETYGSPAIAYGRVYFTTEAAVYCLGSEDSHYEVSASPAQTHAPEAEASGGPATLLVVPGDVTTSLGSAVEYRVEAFSDNGRSLGTVDATWSAEGIDGTFAGSTFTTSGSSAQAGEIVARSGDLEARARLRAFGGLPYEESFDIEGRGRPYWIGAGRYQIAEVDGEKVLEKPVAERGLLRSRLTMGPTGLNNTTVYVEMRGARAKRRITDGGPFVAGYELDLLGNSQKLQVRAWAAVKRMAVEVPFSWEVDVWYAMKLRVEHDGEKAMIYGKVWPRSESEPAEWSIQASDPLPHDGGSPGVQAYSPASVYFDNFKVTENE